MAMEFGTSPVWVLDVLDWFVWHCGQAVSMPTDRIFPHLGSLDDLLQEPPHDQFIAILMQDCPFEPGISAGVGMAQQVVDSKVIVASFSRIWKDKPPQSRNQYAELSRGMSDQSRKLAVYLHRHAGESRVNLGKSILKEPMRIHSMAFNPRKPAPGWAWCQLTFSVKFVASL
jgi:hypothetical protein